MDAAPDFECFVPGTPRPQGSKSQGRNGQMYDTSDYLKAWRDKMMGYAFAARDGVVSSTVAALNSKTFSGPLVLGVEFLFERPKKHFRTLRVSGGGRDVALREDAPLYVTRKPDLGKCLRAAEDSLDDAGVYGDDAQIVGYAGFPLTCKRYANPGEVPGARIRVWRLA